jgi:Raf kinase inhibitor-like YbhB/YbcL family protein
MKLTSVAFADQGKIPSKYTCDGQNISPPLEIHDVPEGTKSLVLIMDDPDVPRHIRREGVWDHWIVFNIPITISQIHEGQNPAGILGKNTRGEIKYGGPCPPDKEHRYYFKLYALDIFLDLKEGVTKFEVEQAMKEHIINQTQLMGRYERK